jgi:protein SCO1/2
MTPYRISLVVALMALATATGVWFARQTLQSSAPVELTAGTRISPPRELAAFSLTSHRGEPFGRDSLTGHWTLMFFGFTHCPGVCPTTLATLVDVRRQLGELDAAEIPRIVLVSVDPERDSPATMADYVARFDPSVIGVTGPADAIDQFAASVGVAHRKVPMSGGEYMVDHSAFILLLDPQGRQAAVFSPPHDAGQLASDYLRMLGRG